MTSSLNNAIDFLNLATTPGATTLGAATSGAAPVLGFVEWFRPGAATHVNNVDGLFWGITWVGIFFTVLVGALGVLFVVKYRHRPGHKAQPSAHHNNTLEVVWSVIPLLIVIVIFFYGFKGYLDSRTPPDNAYVIDVEAYKWGWAFKYNNGSIVDTDLHVPVGRPVKLVMSSKDVLHSLYIPAFRVKMDCVPGRYTTMWFEATQASEDDNKDGTLTYAGEGEPGPPPVGHFDLFCTEYCGTGHSSMYAKVVVHESGGFEKWIKDKADPTAQGTPAEVGASLYTKRGCAQCHSVSGVDNPGNGGPSFKGYYGKTVAWTNGNSGPVDENYIRESILQPMAKIRKGYRPIMPSYQGQFSDAELYAIIQYIKSVNELEPDVWLSEHTGEAPKDGSDGDAGDGEAGGNAAAAEQTEGGEQGEGGEPDSGRAEPAEGMKTAATNASPPSGSDDTEVSGLARPEESPAAG
ncbi:MAG: cytochrome c oxidase subunit II [Planctomycetota bacterium]